MSAIITVYDTKGITVVEFLPFSSAASSVLLSEQLEASSDITEQPVERGAPMADHAIHHGKVLTLEVFVTRQPNRPDVFRQKGFDTVESLKLPTPYTSATAPFPGSPGSAARGVANLAAGRTVPQWATVKRLSFDGQDFDPVDEVGATLDAIRKESLTCSVTTSVDTVNDLQLLAWRRIRSANEGTGALFTATFRQVTKANALTVSAPVPAVTEPRGKVRSNKGSQGTPKAQDGTTPVPESLLIQLGAGKLF